MAIANTQSKKEIAYQGIRQMILSGKYTPSDTLPERQLCQELGVSRTPVCEALQALVNDGMLEIIEGKGVVVRKVNLRDLIEIFELRLALESLAVYLFVERATADTVAQRRHIFDTAEQALIDDDHPTFMEYDMKFHHYIAQESKNVRLKQTIVSNYDQIQLMAVSVRDDPELCRIASQNHQAIMEAVERRDKEAATQHMSEHIKQIKLYHQNRYYLFE